MSADSGQAAEPAGENRRRLIREECLALLALPLVGVFSTLSTSGWIHSVPVHYIYTDGECRILTSIDAVKTRNVQRTGQATLCVEVADGTVRRFVSICGPGEPPAPARAGGPYRAGSALLAQRLPFRLG